MLEYHSLSCITSLFPFQTGMASHKLLKKDPRSDHLIGAGVLFYLVQVHSQRELALNNNPIGAVLDAVVTCGNIAGGITISRVHSGVKVLEGTASNVILGATDSAAMDIQNIIGSRSEVIRPGRAKVTAGNVDLSIGAADVNTGATVVAVGFYNTNTG